MPFNEATEESEGDALMTFRYTCPVLLLLLALPLFGCSEKGDGELDRHTKSEKEATVELRLPGGDWGLPTPFTFYPRGPGYIHMSLVYDTLIWKGREGVIPWLAERWESAADGASWTFHLRNDVRWQDGKPLTARDVHFTIDYLRRNPVEWFTIQNIRDVEVPDDFTVIFHLDGPYAPFLSNVAGSIPILPEHVWRDVADPRASTGIERSMGSGPYRLVSYDKTQGAYAYEANEDFFLGPPQVRKLFFVPAPDQVAALQRGDVDQATIPISLLPQFRNGKQFETLSGPAYWVLTLQFNRNQAPFSDPAVRHACAHAIDPVSLIEQAVPGGLEGAKPGSPGFLPPESRWYTSEVQVAYSFDRDKAKSLLQSVGIEDRDGDGTSEASDGSPMRFALITTAPYLREAEALKLMLREVGVNLELRALDIKTLDAMVREGRFDLALTGHGGIGGDPAVIMGFGAAHEGLLYPGTPSDPEYLRMAKLLLTTSDPSERTALCNTMQRLYARELPTLPLYYPVSFIAYLPQKFKGWFFTADGGIGIGVPMVYNKLAFVGEKNP
jgi:peptide/nickel transport system substrate-binding protein